jgi:hypothetical protein
VLLGAGDLTFVTFGESLVHVLRLHLREADHYEALGDLEGIRPTGRPVAIGDCALRRALSAPSKPRQCQNRTRGQQPASGLRNSSRKVDLVVDQIEVR